MAGTRKQDNPVLTAAKREDYNVVKAALVDLKNKSKAKKVSLCEDNSAEQAIDLLADDNGNAGTLLHYAALWGWTDVITYVVESEGINVNLTNKKSGKTPFMLAVENRQMLAALLLLILGANPQAKNNNGYTALHYAIMCDDEETVRFTHWVMKRSIKSESCAKAYPSLAAYLCSPLSGGEQTVCPKSPTDVCDPLNAENDVNVTALMVAVAYGRVRTTKELLCLGACVKRCDADGNTALILVSQITKVEQSKVNWLNRENYNSADEEIMTLLLDYGTCPNVSNFKGRTALHYAVLSRRLNLVQLLLRAGASVNVRDSDGASPRDLAVRSDDEVLRTFMCMSLSKIIRVLGKMAPFPRPKPGCSLCEQHQQQHQEKPLFNPASTCPFQLDSPNKQAEHCHSKQHSPVQICPQPVSFSYAPEPSCPRLMPSAPPDISEQNEKSCSSPPADYK
ncbi:unnamed protein product [Notodromas monacha]|uniref:Uncharacterized protein n=1 Tax=Notodromas monacha TaxID=399045 RepID=A0A7R9GH04_9CRUS|nr:unnamed protein product [Notodromas monacha]CAG0920414.1 unnamed protein product [Notodromas monacha]